MEKITEAMMNPSNPSRCRNASIPPIMAAVMSGGAIASMNFIARAYQRLIKPSNRWKGLSDFAPVFAPSTRLPYL